MTLETVKAIVGPQGFLDDSADTTPFVTEWRDRFVGVARLVVMPATTDEVAGIIRVCAEQRIAIVPQGGNTGLCGGAIPDSSGTQIVLSLKRMRRIRSVDPDNDSMIVDAGCTLQQVQQEALAHDRYFPLSLASEGSCQIGGNLSTNAGGINVLRYGTARSQALGLEVVLPDGNTIDGLRALRKDTAGYDLKQLFIGAEGTLGVITGACLRLRPIPAESHTLMLAIDSAANSIRLLQEMRRRFGESLSAFELMPDRAMRFVTRHIPDARNPFGHDYGWYVLVTIATSGMLVESELSQLIDDGLVIDAVMAKSGAETESLWKLRHTISEAQKPEGVSLKHDISVPIASVARFIEAAEAAVLSQMPDSRVVAFGHVGDGNVHFNVSQPSDASAADFTEQREKVADIVYKIVADFGGSFSAEHGIGQTRRAHLQRYRSVEEITAMRTVKSALDPQGIMNPGKVL